MANEKKSKIRTALLRSNSILDDAELVLDVTPNRANRLYVGREGVRVKDLRYFVISNSPLLGAGGEVDTDGVTNVSDIEAETLTEALNALKLNQEDQSTVITAISLQLATVGATGKTVWVDSVNGNDSGESIGLRGRSDKPFANPAAARAVAVSGDLIRVRPGNYAVTTNLAKNGVNWDVELGARITMTTDADGSLFDDIGEAMTYKVTGRGVFVRSEISQTEGFANVIKLTNAGSVVHFEAHQILNTCNEESSGEGVSGTAAIYHGHGSLTVHCHEIEAEAHAYYWIEGPAWIHADTIRSNGNSGGDGDGVLCRPPDGNADNVFIHARRIISVMKSAIYSSLSLSAAPTFRLWIAAEQIAGGTQGVQAASGKVYVSAQKISASRDGGVVVSCSDGAGSELYVNAQKIASADTLTEASAFVLLSAGRGKVRISCLEWSVASITTWTANTPLFSISSTNPIDAELIGGTLVLPSVINSPVIGNSNSTGGGLRVFKGMRIDGKTNGAATPLVSLSDDLTILDSCTLIADEAEDSISADEPHTAVCYNSYTNTAVNGNVTAEALTVAGYVR